MDAGETHARRGVNLIGDNLFDGAAIIRQRGMDGFYINQESGYADGLRTQRTAKAEIGRQNFFGHRKVLPVPDVVVETFNKILAVRHADTPGSFIRCRYELPRGWTPLACRSHKLAAFACFRMSTGHAHALRRRRLTG